MMKTTSGGRPTPLQKLGSHTDEQLVAAAKLGDQVAFAELWHRHANRLYGFMWRITRNHEDAEDALQDAFMKAYSHLRGFDGRSRFSTWMNRIALNTALMILRRRRTRPSISLDSSDESLSPPQLVDPGLHPEEAYSGQELRSALSAAIQQLPPTLRGVLDVRLVQDSPIKDIALAAGISVPAAKSRLMRARGVIRRSMERRGQL